MFRRLNVAVHVRVHALTFCALVLLSVLSLFIRGRVWGCLHTLPLPILTPAQCEFERYLPKLHCDAHTRLYTHAGRIASHLALLLLLATVCEGADAGME